MTSRRFTALAVGILFAGPLSVTGFAQNSAPSSHMVFDDNFDGDIIINQVRVPKVGEAMFTYYETLGWRGTGAGYAGIQAHPKAHNFIFSIWDNKQHKAPIRAVHHGPGTLTEKFGGEGTGLKSWNFELGWKTDTWYTLVARNWPVDDHRHFGFWVRADDTGQWTHLVTMDVAAKDATFKGGTDAFIEDWLNTGKHRRTSHLKGGWKRKTNGNWHAFQSARYSVNSWDLVAGKRSFNFRENWNGGTNKSADSEYFFMTAGGKTTRPTTTNPSSHAIKRTERQPDLGNIAIAETKAKLTPQGLQISWKLTKPSTPQFACRLEVFDNAACTGTPLVSHIHDVPHSKSAMIPSGQLTRGKLYLRVTPTDIFDRVGTSTITKF